MHREQREVNPSRLHLTGTQFLKITDRLLDDSTDCIETEGAPRASQNASYADLAHTQL
jgi:hypothetical protein